VELQSLNGLSLALTIQNAFVESFNGRMRGEFLNETLFFGIDDARAKIALRVADYNTTTAGARLRP
jgi:putative transposase